MESTRADRDQQSRKGTLQALAASGEKPAQGPQQDKELGSA